MQITLISMMDRVVNYPLRLFKAILEQEGYDVRLLFFNISNFEVIPNFLFDQFRAFIADSQLVGLHVLTHSFYKSILLTEIIKNNTDATVVWGGPHPMMMPDECLRYTDYICYSTGYRVLSQMSQRIADGNHDFSGINGIAFMKDGKVIYESKETYVDLNLLPPQDYTFSKTYYIDENRNISQFPLQTYKSVDMYGKRYKDDRYCCINYETMITVGCTRSCSFCLNSRKDIKPYQAGRSAEHVINELKIGKGILGDDFTSVTFYDDNLLSLPLDYLEFFFAEYKKEIGVPFSLSGGNAPDWNEDKIKILVDAGMTFIAVGVQSITDKGRHVFKNPSSKANLINVTNIASQFKDKMRVQFSMIFDNPYESDEDFCENLLFLNFLKKPFYLGSYHLVLYPGTKLYSMLKDDKLNVDRFRFIEGYVDVLQVLPTRKDIYYDILVKFLEQRAGQERELPRYTVKRLKGGKINFMTVVQALFCLHAVQGVSLTRYIKSLIGNLLSLIYLKDSARKIYDLFCSQKDRSRKRTYTATFYNREEYIRKIYSILELS